MIIFYYEAFIVEVCILTPIYEWWHMLLMEVKPSCLPSLEGNWWMKKQSAFFVIIRCRSIMLYTTRKWFVRQVCWWTWDSRWWEKSNQSCNNCLCVPLWKDYGRFEKVTHLLLFLILSFSFMAQDKVGAPHDSEIMKDINKKNCTGQ